MLAEAKHELESEGTPFDRTMELASWWKFRQQFSLRNGFCDEVDFLSIGTNDLIQYLSPVDRNNRKVASFTSRCIPRCCPR